MLLKRLECSVWFFSGIFCLTAVGCLGGVHEDTVSDSGIGKSTKEVQAAVASKTSATAGEIRSHAEEPPIVEKLAERIVTLNGLATLADANEAKELVKASKSAWEDQLKKDAELADKNRELHSKLNAAISKAELIAIEAEQLRKDKQVEPFRRAMYVALLFLIYYAVVKKDPIQSVLCGAITMFCGAAPWFYDSAAFGWLIWVVCGGLAIYACFFFYDLLKTKLAAKHAIGIAEKLKATTTPEETAAVLAGASEAVGGIAKAGIREARAELGIAEKEGTRLFSFLRKTFS